MNGNDERATGIWEMNRDDVRTTHVELTSGAVIGAACVELDASIADPAGFHLDAKYLPSWRNDRREIECEALPKRD